MSYTVPSTKALVDRNVATIENALGVKAPISDRSFVRTIAAMEGMSAAQLYALIIDRIQQCFARTADAASLADMGNPIGVYRKPAQQWEGTATIDIPSGKTLYINTIFVAGNGLSYVVTESVTAEAGAALEFSLACTVSGPAGNLNTGDTLTLQVPVAGWSQTAEVTAITMAGVEVEDIETYRQRVLDAQSGDLALGTAASYRNFSQSVAGVARAYPFAGKPTTSSDPSYPGDRTIYIQATPDIEPDGIPPQALLDLVRKALIRDPDTGASRVALGETVDNLYVAPIKRTPIYVTVVGMKSVTGTTAGAEEQVESAIGSLLRSYAPFIQGLDADFDRRDELLTTAIAGTIQSVLQSFGGGAEAVTFSLEEDGSGVIGHYQLGDNELLSLGGITYQDIG